MTTRVLSSNSEAGDRPPWINLGGKLIGYTVVALLVIILFSSSLTTVNSGHVGVLTLFGRVTGETLPEGIHMINPLKSVHEMSIRTQETKETASVPSSEGLTIGLDVSLLFRLSPEKAAEVYQKVGPAYAEVVLVPTMRSAIREMTASHVANSLYSGAREQLEAEAEKQLTSAVGSRGIIIERVLMRDIQLPETLKRSIEAKQQADQDAQKMVFVLQQARQEAERKRIEAQGIADFQNIVTRGISPPLLAWKGIEATEKLADSKNTKVVIIGSGKNGLPLILGGAE
jgi:regulator of protease activity HflC (stomatin/prohibitin superfamily)